MAHDNEVDEVNFRYRDTGFVSIEVSRYFEDDITVRAGGAWPTGDISPDWLAAAGRRGYDRNSTREDSHMESLFQKMMMQLSELGMK